MTADYKVEDYKSLKSLYSYNYEFPELEDLEFCETDYLCLDFPSIQDFNNNKYIEIVRMIERFTFVEENWDGFNAIPLSSNVAEKAKVIVENINLNYFTNYNVEVKITPYSTLIIDWFDEENELSLEIGKDYLGYYCDGEKVIKEVDKIDITTPQNIVLAITQIENDLKAIF